ncbi:Hypothetical predicted protein [Olea europaea subsp. europaea]|uniref:Uncharacterized protein n=1 Tax=Olea europaea subsp. europaea TaxID=158383 RepID=A0A8S0QUY1_OLEEU|nr:Hypothetical predicted protein [Olea europaea subsp. europaea]
MAKPGRGRPASPSGSSSRSRSRSRSLSRSRSISRSPSTSRSRSSSSSQSRSRSRRRSRSRSKSFTSSSPSHSDSSRSASPPQRKSPVEEAKRGRSPPPLSKKASPPPRKASPIPESLILHVDQLSRNVNENHLKEIFVLHDVPEVRREGLQLAVDVAALLLLGGQLVRDQDQYLQEEGVDHHLLDVVDHRPTLHRLAHAGLHGGYQGAVVQEGQ